MSAATSRRTLLLRQPPAGTARRDPAVAQLHQLGISTALDAFQHEKRVIQDATMGQSSSQIDPGIQQSQLGGMAPPPQPKARKRRKVSPASSIAGESTTASVQLTRDLEHSTLEASLDVERPRKRKTCSLAVEPDIQPSRKPKKRKALQAEQVLEPQADKSDYMLSDMPPAQVVIQKSRKRKRPAQHGNAITGTVGTSDETVPQSPSISNGNKLEERVQNSPEVQQTDETVTKKPARDSKKSARKSQHRKVDNDEFDAEAQSSIQDNNKPSPAKPASKKRDARPGSKTKDSVEPVSKPNWLDSVPTTSSGAFTREERRIADRVFQDFAAEHNLYEYVLKKMIQNWREEAGGFKAHIQAALPNRSKDAVRKFCQRRYHTMERGPWTEEQDNNLRSAYLQWPDKWTSISDHVDRTAADCKDRWTKHLKFSERNSGPWSTTEMIHLHQLVASCMGAIVDAYDEGELDDENLENPNTYLDLLNWKIIEDKINNVRSAHQCRQKFLKSWPRIVDTMGSKGLQPPFKKGELIHHVSFGSRHDTPQPPQKSDRLDSARKALRDFEIGDFYDVFVEIHTSFDDPKAHFENNTFWSIVGQKNVSRFSITWAGTTVRKIALQTALEDWPLGERKLARKLENADTLQAKALILAKYVEKRQQSESLGKLQRTYKSELIGKSKEEILEIKRNAKAQRKTPNTPKKEKEYLSKDFVSDSEDQEGDQTEHQDEHGDEDGVEAAPERINQEETVGNRSPSRLEHHSTQPYDDSESNESDESEAAEEEGSDSEPSQPTGGGLGAEESDAKEEEPTREIENSDTEDEPTVSTERAAKALHLPNTESITHRVVQNMDHSDSERSLIKEVPESDVEVGQSSHEDSPSSTTTESDEVSEESSDDEQSLDEGRNNDKLISTQAQPDKQREHSNEGASGDTTDDIVVSSVNSRYEESLAGTPGLSPRDFVQRCKTAGRQQHAHFTARNAPPKKVKRTYGSRRKHGF